MLIAPEGYNIISQANKKVMSKYKCILKQEMSSRTKHETMSWVYASIKPYN